MSFDYIFLILIVIGIIGGVIFGKLIKHYNYELNFKESLFYPLSLLILAIICLLDFSLLNINFDFRYCLGFVIYFLLLPLMYYVFRTINLKKYVPIKTIMGFVLISVINSVILFNLFANVTISNISGWDALGLFVIYIALCIIYFALLLFINFTIFIIKIIKKINLDYKNIDYKISKFSIINLVITLLLIGVIFGINYCNEFNYNKLLEKQKDVVVNYLNREYSNYSFEVLESYETKVDCGFMTCVTPAFRNEIKVKELNKIFIVDVKKEDLTIYEDEFKKILEEVNEKEVKTYLLNNYNISLKYVIDNVKLENVEFLINKDYKKEDINLFVSDMKSAFNYIESNFYDLDYVILNFKYGNPFYEGEYDYSKNKGSINENTSTNELWIMVNNEYIFIGK